MSYKIISKSSSYLFLNIIEIQFNFQKDEFQMYSIYCQNKPRSEELRTEVGDNNPFFKECQRKLGHKLPLGAYLLKPVQRITKYQLLLKVCITCTHLYIFASTNPVHLSMLSWSYFYQYSPSHWMLFHITIFKTVDSFERGMNSVAVTIIKPWKEMQKNCVLKQ